MTTGMLFRMDAEAWQRGFDAGKSGLPSEGFLQERRDRYAWVSGYIEGKAARSNPAPTLSERGAA